MKIMEALLSTHLMQSKRILWKSSKIDLENRTEAIRQTWWQLLHGCAGWSCQGRDFSIQTAPPQIAPVMSRPWHSSPSKSASSAVLLNCLPVYFLVKDNAKQKKHYFAQIVERRKREEMEEEAEKRSHQHITGSECKGLIFRSTTSKRMTRDRQHLF